MGESFSLDVRERVVNVVECDIGRSAILTHRQAFPSSVGVARKGRYRLRSSNRAVIGRRQIGEALRVPDSVQAKACVRYHARDRG
jgi:hypothetical protein